MKILIAGATGCVGSELVPHLLGCDHKLTILGRDSKKIVKQFADKCEAIEWDSLSQKNAGDYDAVINLSGVNINSQRWDKAFKQSLLDSRINTTSQLIEWANQSTTPIRFLNASAAHSAYWGAKPGDFIDESFVNRGDPESFTNELVGHWEGVLERANDQLSVAVMRFAVVLTPKAGALKEIIDKSYLKTYAIVGSGEQAFVWIDINDLIAAIDFLLNRSDLIGAFNLVSPDNCSQAEFARAFAKVFKKYIPLRLPAWLVRVMFGEVADELLLSGTYIVPKKLLDAGFLFQYANLDEALTKLKKGHR